MSATAHLLHCVDPSDRPTSLAEGHLAATLTIFDGNHAGYPVSMRSGFETTIELLKSVGAGAMLWSFVASRRIVCWSCRGRDVGLSSICSHWLEQMGEKGFPSLRAVILLDVLRVGSAGLCSCNTGPPSECSPLSTNVLWICCPPSKTETCVHTSHNLRNTWNSRRRECGLL